MTPITVLADDYHRAFRVASELQPVPPDAPPTHIDGKPVPFDPSIWGLHDFVGPDQALLRFDEQILTLIDDIDAEEAEQLLAPGEVGAGSPGRPDGGRV